MKEPKPLTRLYTDAPLSTAALCDLDASPAHKLRAVLRAQTGDDVLLFNGRDGEWRARLEALGKSRAQAVCLHQTRLPRPERGPWLAFAPLKKDRLDFLVEKAVELGVERLIPVLTRRTENRRPKIERLRQQIIDATEQCERLSLPTLSEPVALDGLAATWPAERTLIVAAERASAQPLAQVLRETLVQSSAHRPGQSDVPLGLLIGPEGGFAAGELDGVLKMSISIPVSLGPRILRAETAAVAALAIMQALTGDWNKQP